MYNVIVTIISWWMFTTLYFLSSIVLVDSISLTLDSQHTLPCISCTCHFASQRWVIKHWTLLFLLSIYLKRLRCQIHVCLLLFRGNKTSQLLPCTWVIDTTFSYPRQENSTGRGVPTFSVWYRAWLSGIAHGWFSLLSFTSVITTSQRFPQRQRVAVKRTLLAYFSLKCIYQWGTRKIIKSQCWNQTYKSQSRVIRCHIPVSATALTGICDIVSPSTEICQSGSNTGTWFY